MDSVHLPPRGVADHVGQRAPYDVAIALAQPVGRLDHHQMMADKLLFGRDANRDPLAITARSA